MASSNKSDEWWCYANFKPIQYYYVRLYENVTNILNEELLKLQTVVSLHKLQQNMLLIPSTKEK